MSKKRNTPAPEAVTVRKNNFASSLTRSAPGPLQIFCWSGLPWQLYFILSTHGSANLVFYMLKIFQQTAGCIAELDLGRPFRVGLRFGP